MYKCNSNFHFANFNHKKNQHQVLASSSKIDSFFFKYRGNIYMHSGTQSRSQICNIQTKCSMVL